MRLRGSAGGAATAGACGPNSVVTVAFLTLLSAIGITGTFVLLPTRPSSRWPTSSGRCPRPRTAACKTSNETSTFPSTSITGSTAR